MIAKARTIIKNIFGYENFRPLQEDVIKNILEKNDTLVIMPTGGGKSLCYQIPALIFNGLTIVISPLISLMKDQVEQLNELGVNAVFLNSSLSYEKYQENVSLIVQKKVKLLYLAPETLFKQKTLGLLSALKIDSLTIDEAHCISEWGHDFRPEYRQLAQIRERFPSAVCVALTATATQRVRKDIKEILGFSTSNSFVASFDRTNLFLEIKTKVNPLEQTIEHIKKFPDNSGIIYCFSRKQVDGLSNNLKEYGFSVKPYHAGLTETERRENQELFIRDDVQIIVATIAFGMGINKPNVRFVIHYDLPKNIEGYYQEIGRAGRDGLQAHCLLLFSYGDLQKVKYFIKQKEESEQLIANIHLNALVGFVESDACRRIPLLNYFGEDYSKTNCGICDNCISGEKQLVDITIPAQKFLSCVKRTDEIFGISHIIDVLRGSKSQKIAKFNHQDLSTYGIGKDFSKNQWFHMARQFIQKGLMEQDLKFGSLKLKEKTYDVFKGKELVFGTLQDEHKEYVQKEEIDLKYDKKLFDILRKERKELADTSNVPPYVIFPDKTLIDISTHFPQSRESLLKMHGIGNEKLRKYGDIFLDIICKYCKESQIEELPKITSKKLVKQIAPSMTRKYVIISEEYNSGASIRELMEKYNIKSDTVINHLFEYFTENGTIRRDGLLESSNLNSQQQSMVFKSFDKLGTDLLKPIFSDLNEEISYGELKLLLLYYNTN